MAHFWNRKIFAASKKQPRYPGTNDRDSSGTIFSFPWCYLFNCGFLHSSNPFVYQSYSAYSYSVPKNGTKIYKHIKNSNTYVCNTAIIKENKKNFTYSKKWREDASRSIYITSSEKSSEQLNSKRFFSLKTAKLPVLLSTKEKRYLQ